MVKGLKGLILLGVATLLMAFIDRLLEYPDSFIAQILPNSVLRLSINHAKGLGLTFVAALFAWLWAILLGYVLGMISSITVVDRSAPKWLRRIGRGIDRFYELVWVVPFILTISLAYAIGMNVHVNDGVPRFVVGLALIATCGVVLGGFIVYRSVFRAVNDAKAEDRYLVLSLYSAHGSKESARFWSKISQAWVQAKRLRDCEIRQFREALITAFFLSLVAVMILEMVTPSLYEWFLPQAGATRDWLGGAGRQVLKAKEVYSYETVAGVIWIVILFTLTLSYAIQSITNHLWLQYYGGPE